MLISHKHKFIAIDVPKTGTTSINAVLDGTNRADFTAVDSVKIGMRHATYNECIAKFPNCKNYFRFAFIRNPWDRLLSFYFFKKHNDRVKISKDMSFKDYLKSSSFLDQFKYEAKNQFSYVDGFGEFSFIGRFENLQQDFNAICDKIKIPTPRLPHLNKTTHTHYTEYYDDETREIVAKKYAQDIEYFGYKFGE
jgi:hypothetical protein